MSIQIIKKAFGLLIIDIVIIIGIFVLQFRTDSNIIEKIGNLQITIAKSDLNLNEYNNINSISNTANGSQNNLSNNIENNNEYELKNKLKISYNGISYFFDEQNPAKIKRTDGNLENAVLKSYTKPDEFTYNFIFADDVNIKVQLESNDNPAGLILDVNLPDSIDAFYLPYNYGYGMKIFKEENSNVVFQGRKSFWEMAVPGFKDSYIEFTKADSIALYGIYNEIKEFTFEDLIDSELADSTLLASNIENLKKGLITAFESNTIESYVNEQTLISYVAAKAEKGKYSEAVDEVSQNLKKNVQRTFLSSPYFDSLSIMNADLEQSIKDMENQITKASYNNSMDIFAVRNLASYLNIHSNPGVVEKLLRNAASSDVSSMHLEISVGILQVYNELYGANKEFADLLLPVIPDCVQVISKNCNYDNKVLTISQNDTFLSVLQAVETGVALMRYGMISKSSVLQKAGNVIINSYISDFASFDLRTMSNIYPIIAYNNWYYPHLQKINTNDNSNIWAWTCAEGITYAKENDTSSSLIIDFPESATHYVIIRGVPQFKRIYIYNTLFRSDPRFETYNSSGYIYKSDTNTLLLKSKHKVRMEEIRFEY